MTRLGVILNKGKWTWDQTQRCQKQHLKYLWVSPGL